MVVCGYCGYTGRGRCRNRKNICGGGLANITAVKAKILAITVGIVVAVDKVAIEAEVMVAPVTTETTVVAGKIFNFY